MKIEVTQADRDAAADWYRDCMDQEHIAREIDSGKNDNMLVRAFARLRLATRTDATPVAWMYERKGQETLVFAYRWQDPVERPGWREIPLAPINRATDVAALVEAAKETNAALERDGDPAFAHLILDNKAALAPFTKGQP